MASLIVSNVARPVDESWLRRLFVQFGEVATVAFASPPSQGPRIAVVEMPDAGAAAYAIRSLDGQCVAGCHICVEPQLCATHPPARC